MLAILVVEANDVIRRAVVGELTGVYDVTEVDDEHAALSAAAANSFDALVVAASFVALLDELGRTCPTAARIIVAPEMTTRVAQLAVDAGFADRLVSFPWDFYEIRDAVNQLCDVARIVSARPAKDLVVPEQVTTPRAPLPLPSDGDDPLARLHAAMASARQKRKHPRINARLEVKVHFSTWSLYRLAYTVNISRGGILCQLDTEPSVGDEAAVEVLLPDGRSVCATARVRRVTEHELTITSELLPGSMPKRNVRYEVGLEFTALDGRDERAFKATLKKLQKAYWDAPREG